MLFIKELKPTLNTQSDSFYSAEYFIYLFVKFLYFSFHHLPFVTLSTYFHIFIAFYILTCDFTSYMQNSIHFFYFKMISARSKRRILFLFFVFVFIFLYFVFFSLLFWLHFFRY